MQNRIFQLSSPFNIIGEIGWASICRQMEVTSSELCLKALVDLQIESVFEHAPDVVAGHIKFLSEVLIAFKDIQNEYADEILDTAQSLLFSIQTRRAIACNPAIAHCFLTAYASIPSSRRERSWTELLRNIIEAFPPMEGDMPKFRTEEINFAKKKLFGAGRLRIDIEEYVLNAPCLSRDQVYAFTHRIFYLTDYGAQVCDLSTEHVCSFIEDKCIQFYMCGDIDVLLELIICYKTFADHDRHYLLLFKLLAYRLLLRSKQMSSIIVDGDFANFKTYYHQALLFIILNSIDKQTDEAHNTQVLRSLFGAIRARNQFIASARGLDFVKVYRSFVRLDRSYPSDYYRVLLHRYTRALRITGVVTEEIESKNLVSLQT